MSISRRDFLRAGLNASTALVLGLRANALSAANIDFDASAIMDLSRIVVPDPQTLQYVVGSICCQFCTNYFIVHHYMPVAFVEVTKGPDDSIFSGGGSGSPLTSSVSSDGKTGHTFAARVWDIPETVIDIAFGFQSCRLCGKPESSSNPSRMINPAKLAELAETASCVPPIDMAASLQKEMLSGVQAQLMDMLPFKKCIPTLLYDTSADPHWLNGCRDIPLAASAGPLCEESGLGLASQLTDLVGGSSFNPCVGDWGAVVPRQQRVVQQDIQTAAALTAYRAIHVSAYTWGTFPYDASLKGKLQPTIPEATTGRTPGTNKLIFNQGQSTPDDGRWGFVWWVPVTCCKNLTEIAGYCTPSVPCM